MLLLMVVRAARVMMMGLFSIYKSDLRNGNTCFRFVMSQSVYPFIGFFSFFLFFQFRLCLVVVLPPLCFRICIEKFIFMWSVEAKSGEQNENKRSF